MNRTLSGLLFSGLYYNHFIGTYQTLIVRTKNVYVQKHGTNRHKRRNKSAENNTKHDTNRHETTKTVQIGRQKVQLSTKRQKMAPHDTPRHKTAQIGTKTAKNHITRHKNGTTRGKSPQTRHGTKRPKSVLSGTKTAQIARVIEHNSAQKAQRRHNSEQIGTTMAQIDTIRYKNGSQRDDSLQNGEKLHNYAQNGIK